MTPAGKKKLSEIDICDLFISPAIKAAGWDQLTQIRREVTLAPGPITGGNIASRNKKKKKFADYVLYQEPNVPIGVARLFNRRYYRCAFIFDVDFLMKSREQNIVQNW